MVGENAGVAAITGASRGIGAALAAHLASRGWSLALCARSDETLRATAERIRADHDAAIHAQPADVADPESMRRFADAAGEALGPARLLINNAAVFGPVGPLVQTDLQAFRAAVDIGLLGTVNATAAFLDQLSVTSEGRVVNLSGGGVGGPSPVVGAPAYVACKSAVVALTEALADDLADLGATVNCIAPGAMPTGFMDAALEAGPEVAGAALHASASELQRGGDLTLPDGLTGLLDYLIGSEGGWVSGCLLSARWDTPETLAGHRDAIRAGNHGRLRRIDADLFHEAPR